MIVTRRRHKPFPWKRVAIPLLAIALIAAAFVWPTSQRWIVTGPLAPVAAPLHFAAQNQLIGNQNRQIAALQQQLAQAQSQTATRDRQISTLKTQLAQAQAQPEPTAVPVPRAPQNPVVQTADLAAGASPDTRRVAQEWASMDPGAAAKVVQRLPLAYVARIFAVMTPDAAGAILENLTPTYAAQLTEEHPELRR